MPDTRTHRGPHPNDAKIFAAALIPDLRRALADYCLLLTKGYAEKSALKLVGDRFSLTKRQRLAIMRSACSDKQLQRRKEHEVDPAAIGNRKIAIDGYNLLITIEAAISGAVIFQGRDNCLRDLAGIHGTYRKVTETIPAVELIGRFLEEKGVTDVLWLLDSPVSNSGRLKQLIAEISERSNWAWQIELCQNPDAELIKTDAIVVSTDSVILDACQRWTNLTGAIIETGLQDSWLVNLS